MQPGKPGSPPMAYIHAPQSTFQIEELIPKCCYCYCCLRHIVVCLMHRGAKNSLNHRRRRWKDQHPLAIFLQLNAIPKIALPCV
jgi:hypothetical protein